MSDIALINISIGRHFENKVVYERSAAGFFSLIATLEKAGLGVDFYEHFMDSRRTFKE